MKQKKKSNGVTFKKGNPGRPFGAKNKKKMILSEIGHEMVSSPCLYVEFRAQTGHGTVYRKFNINMQDASGVAIPIAVGMNAAMIIESLRGNVHAYCAMRDTIQGKPNIAIDVTSDGDKIDQRPLITVVDTETCEGLKEICG